MKTHSARQSSQGAVMAELSIILVLLLICCSGILSMGKLIEANTWASQTTYQLGSYAADTTSAQRTTNVDNLFMTLSSMHNGVVRKRGANNLQVSYNENSDDAQVTFSGQTNMHGLLSKAYPFTYGVTVPLLMKGTGSAGSASTFEDPLGNYDCCGRKCGSEGASYECPPTSCLSCTGDSCVRSPTCS